MWEIFLSHYEDPVEIVVKTHVPQDKDAIKLELISDKEAWIRQ